MRLYRSSEHPDHWIGEDEHGVLMLWPARPRGWAKRTGYVGAKRQLEEVGPGTIFGEMALIDLGPRSASAVAVTDCELVSIEKRRFWFLVQETPYFAETVMRVMAERLRRRAAVSSTTV